MVIILPLNVTWSDLISIVSTIVEPFLIKIFPDPPCTDSLNVSEILPFLLTPVALSAGDELLSVGLDVSAVARTLTVRV